MAEEWNNGRCVVVATAADLSSVLASNIEAVTSLVLAVDVIVLSLWLQLALNSRSEPPPNYFVQATQRITEIRSNK